MKKVIAINAGPRKGWNTDLLIKEAAKGAEDSGAEVIYYDLYKMNCKGCVSCFACKTEASFGKCALKDDIGEILEQIRTADALIIGSPNYLGNLTAGFRALYERLVFQSLTYNKETPCCNAHQIPTLLIMTSNCGEEAYDAVGYSSLLDGYKNTLSRFVGPTQVLTCGNTLQVKDYSKYNWTMFDPEAKKQHREDTFDNYLKKAYAIGSEL